MSVNELHITVAAAPNVEFGNPRLLAHDLRLAKSAVLYADRVTLCSATAWWSSSFFSLAVSPKSDREKIQVLYELYKSIGPLVDPNAERMIPTFEKYLRLVHRNPILLTNKDRKMLNGFREMILSQWGTLSSEFVRITRGFGFDEIEEAVGAGLLDGYPFSEGVVENFALEYFDVVQQILGNSASHPLLDEQTNGLISAALVEGKLTIESAASKRTKQTGLVADLFDRLPVFDVPMAELIDLREDLGRPLIAFRSKIVELSKEVESAVWDKDFEGERLGDKRFNALPKPSMNLGTASKQPALETNRDP